MVVKFGKTFKLTIQMNDNPNQAIVIEPPFTIDFDINRDMEATANTGNFKIYNLSPSTRKQIFQDLFDLSSIRKIIFEAGYNNKLSTLFVGTLKTAYSSRSGANIITEINAWDDGFGSMMTYFINKTYSAGWTQKDIAKAQMQGMAASSGMEMGEVGELDTNPNPRGISLVGNGFALLNKTTNGLVFIDNNRINALKPHEVIDGLVQVIDSSTGLLGTPKRQDAKLSVDCIFEPRILVGQVIEIDSDVQPEYNGQYKIIGIHHTGTISETVAAECKTEIQLLAPNLMNNGQDMNIIRGDDVIPVTQNFKINIRPEINKLIYFWCSKYGVDQNLLKAIIKQESGFRQYRGNGSIVRSGAGAIGICQLMPDTAKSLHVNPYDLSDNIHGGTKYLANVLAHYHGDKYASVASYNAGQGAVDCYLNGTRAYDSYHKRWINYDRIKTPHGIPPYNETRNYVRVVMGNYAVFKRGR